MPSGWKSIAAGALGVISGFALIILKPDQIEIGIGFIIGGLGIVGVAHKIEKGSK